MKIKSRLTILLLMLSLFACCQQNDKNESTSRRPNILFIMSDDHAYQAISAYQDHLIQTPNIDPLYADTVIKLKDELAALRVKYKDSEELDQHFIDMIKE